MARELRTVVVMARERHTAEQRHMAALHPMAEERRTAATTATVPHTAASAQEVAHLLGVARQETRPQSRVVCRLLRLAHTTRRLQVPMPLLRLADMVRTLRRHLAVHRWMLLHRATTLHRHLATRLVDMGLPRRLHRVAGT